MDGSAILSAESSARSFRDRGRALLFRLLPYALIALSLALFALETWSMQGFVSGDFDIFRMAAQRVLADPVTLYDYDGGAAAAARSLMGYIYPPPSVVLFLPLALMERMTAYHLTGWLMFLSALAALALWLRLCLRAGIAGRDGAVLTAVVALALVTGAVFTCRMGRIDTLVLLAMVAAVALGEGWGRERGQGQAARFWGGALLALGTWIKIYPMLLLIPRLFDRGLRRSSLAGFAAAGAAVPLLCLAFLPLSVWIEFFHVMLPEMSRRTIVNIDNQSLAAIAGRLVAPRQIAVDNSFTAVELPFAVRWTILAAGLFAILVLQRFVRARGRSPLFTAAIVMALTSLIAPLGWGHSYAYVLPLFVMVLAQALERRSIGWTLAIGAGWAAQVIPAHNLIPAIEGIDPLFHVYYARNAVATLVFIAAQVRFLRSEAPVRGQAGSG